MLQIQNKIEFENNCWVGLVDSSNFNSNEENRIKAVTDIASITKGRLGFSTSCHVFIEKYKHVLPTGLHLSNSTLESMQELFSKEENKHLKEYYDNIDKYQREKLYNKLLTESAGKPSTPFEFVPCIYPFKNNVTRITDTDFNTYFKYGYSNNEQFYTNYRNVLNIKQSVDKWLITNAEEVKDFKVIVGRVPWKVISHLRTHRAFSWLVESSRNKKYLNEVEFWYPSWWDEDLLNFWRERDRNNVEILQDIVNRRKFVENIRNYKPEEATMELSDRRLVTFAMAAWKQDTNAWDNLFAVRGNKTGTMSITQMTINNIKKLINN